MFVKICGITSEADALLAVGLGADAIGFVFAPSPRQVTPKAVEQIVSRVPKEVITVGVFRNEAPSRVVEIVNDIGLRGAQLHGDESTEQSSWVAVRVPWLIKAFPAGDRGISQLDRYGADAVLVDGRSPGSGEVFDWRLAEGVADPSRLIVAGGLTASNVGDAVAHLRPFGVDVSTGVESQPGKKDPVMVREFINAARKAGETFGASRAPLGSRFPILGSDVAVEPIAHRGVGAWGADAADLGSPTNSSGPHGFETSDDSAPFDWEADQ